jgi:hypothetical protein
MLTQKLIPLLKKPTKGGQNLVGDTSPSSKVINLSARVGSIDDNR